MALLDGTIKVLKKNKKKRFQRISMAEEEKNLQR
jgi:hypothetical protein